MEARCFRPRRKQLYSLPEVSTPMHAELGIGMSAALRCLWTQVYIGACAGFSSVLCAA